MSNALSSFAQRLTLACAVAVLAHGYLSWWTEHRMNRAETELHQTWLPMVTAVGDLRSDLDAWQEDPVPLMVERVEARLSQIDQLARSGSDLAGTHATQPQLEEVRQLWKSLHTGRSNDWDRLHAQLRQLSVTGLMQSQRLADLAAGRGA